MPQQRSQTVGAGMIRDALKTHGLENESSRADPRVLTMPGPAQLAGGGDIFSYRENTEIRWKELPSGDACCLSATG